MCDLSCAFVTFPYGVLGQVWYSIVSIPDLCLLSYFLTKRVEVCFRRASFCASLYLLILILFCCRDRRKSTQYAQKVQVSYYVQLTLVYREKSGKFGQSAKFGHRLCLFHTIIIKTKNKLRKQTVKILMRRLIKSRLIWISTVCK